MLPKVPPAYTQKCVLHIILLSKSTPNSNPQCSVHLICPSVAQPSITMPSHHVSFLYLDQIYIIQIKPWCLEQGQHPEVCK